MQVDETARCAREPPLVRSLLFVPGSATDRFAKALAANVDLVCLDLEDSVAPDDKPTARSAVLAYVSTSIERERLCVRMNRLGSIHGLEDAAALARASFPPCALMLPKVESAREIDLLAQAFSGSPPHVIALIESPMGVEAAFEIARSPAVSLLLFGSLDYAAESGCAQEWSALLPVRSRVVAAAASVGKCAIDSPYVALDDIAGAAAEARLAQSLGFCGKASIHPKFVADINEAFSPTAQQLAEAEAIVAAFAASKGGVGRVGGKLIEAPVVRRMQRLLQRAAAVRRHLD